MNENMQRNRSATLKQSDAPAAATAQAAGVMQGNTNTMPMAEESSTSGTAKVSQTNSNVQINSDAPGCGTPDEATTSTQAGGAASAAQRKFAIAIAGQVGAAYAGGTFQNLLSNSVIAPL